MPKAYYTSSCIGGQKERERVIDLELAIQKGPSMGGLIHI